MLCGARADREMMCERDIFFLVKNLMVWLKTSCLSKSTLTSFHCPVKSTLNRFDIGVTSVHLVSLGFTWCHSVSLGVTRFHLVSLVVTWTRCYVTQFHSVSLGVTWFHFGVTRFHLVSLGFTLASLGFTWFHSVSPKPGSCGFSESSLPVGRSIFSPFREKKTTWSYLDTFYCQKTGFPGSCWGWGKLWNTVVYTLSRSPKFPKWLINPPTSIALKVP